MSHYRTIDELPDAMTFDEFKRRTALDLRKVAALLEDCAKEAEAGDMDSVEDTVGDRLGLWHQMLYLRFQHCREAVNTTAK